MTVPNFIQLRLCNIDIGVHTFDIFHVIIDPTSNTWKLEATRYTISDSGIVEDVIKFRCQLTNIHTFSLKVNLSQQIQELIPNPKEANFEFNGGVAHSVARIATDLLKPANTYKIVVPKGIFPTYVPNIYHDSKKDQYRLVFSEYAHLSSFKEFDLFKKDMGRFSYTTNSVDQLHPLELVYNKNMLPIFDTEYLKPLFTIS